MKHETLIRKIERLVKKWETLLDLPGIAVEHRFHDAFYSNTEVDATVAETVCRWQYREAVIHWYLSGLCRLEDADLELTLIHEYCHILLGPLADRLKANSEDFNEMATENVARALRMAHRG